MITAQGLRVAFGRTIALDGINLELADGIVGLFGPNASGKTTLLRVLAGLLPPTAGTVAIDGAAIDLRDETLRRRLGYAGHAPGLYGSLTVRENLELFATLYGAEARTDEVLAGMALNDVAGTRVGILSAGMTRRVSLARALVHDPDVLLLDEPYANLDDEAAEMVSGVIKAWHRPGKVAVIATHGAKRVRAFADAGIVLRRGELASYRATFEPEPV